jgi:hypothetical protein
MYIDDVELVQSKCSLNPPSARPNYCPTLPQSCSFQDRTFCGWNSVTDSWNFVDTSTNNTLIYLKYKAKQETLHYQRFCYNSSTPLCLSFRYAFSVNNTIDLRVYIANVPSPTLEAVDWTSSSVLAPGKDDYSDLAQIPIKTTQDFSIKFEASRRVSVPQEGRSVYIDDVKLVQSSCSLSPPSASPDFCHNTEPLNCSFQDSTFCGWSSVNGSWNFVHFDSNTAIQFSKTTKTGKLQSQTSCATQTACLTFRYNFKVNDAIGLSVAVKEERALPRTLWF